MVLFMLYVAESFMKMKAHSRQMKLFVQIAILLRHDSQIGHQHRKDLVISCHWHIHNHIGSNSRHWVSTIITGSKSFCRSTSHCHCCLCSSKFSSRHQSHCNHRQCSSKLPRRRHSKRRGKHQLQKHLQVKEEKIGSKYKLGEGLKLRDPSCTTY
jgi:hypothetical protein